MFTHYPTERANPTMAKRLSRGTPYAMTVQEQEAFVHLLDTNTDMQQMITTIIGKPLADMTFGEKINALNEARLAGYAAAELNQIKRAQLDLRNLAADERGEITAADRASQAEATTEMLREQLATANRTIAELTAEVNRFKAAPVKVPARKAVPHKKTTSRRA